MVYSDKLDDFITNKLYVLLVCWNKMNDFKVMPLNSDFIHICCDISNICALCIGYMNINCAFYHLSFSSVFISKFCVILSKKFRGKRNLRFFLSR